MEGPPACEPMGAPAQARADPQLPITAAQSPSQAEPDHPEKPCYGQSGQVPSTVKRQVGFERRSLQWGDRQ